MTCRQGSRKTRTTPLKLLRNLKVPFGTAIMVRLTGAKYLAWEDAFDVEFDDGLSFLEPHKTIRRKSPENSKK